MRTGEPRVRFRQRLAQLRSTPTGSVRAGVSRPVDHCLGVSRLSGLAHVILAGAVASLALATASSPALADGDPASDVLAAQSLYLPPDSGASASQHADLQGVLNAAARAGYPIRVAVIGSASDLGSVGALWRQPQAYADYVGYELSMIAHGRLLVVMPNGFGLFQPGITAVGDRARLAHTPAPPRSRSLATLAIGGVENLAAASGHAIADSSIHAVRVPRPRATSRITWLAWFGGGALILAAWTLSFRARPPRFGEHRRVPG